MSSLSGIKSPACSCSLALAVAAAAAVLAFLAVSSSASSSRDLLMLLKVNKEDVCFFRENKKRLEVEMEGFDDGFKSDIDYKGFAETSVILFETVSL